MRLQQYTIQHSRSPCPRSASSHALCSWQHLQDNPPDITSLALSVSVTHGTLCTGASVPQQAALFNFQMACTR
jgi:hypothetical protein